MPKTILKNASYYDKVSSVSWQIHDLKFWRLVAHLHNK